MISGLYGIGKTDELNQRISVASLTRVIFNNPVDRSQMLVLERTATLKNLNGHENVEVKSKPFGGGVRILDPLMLKRQIGNFNYDSERSFKEQDFRIFINPSSWDIIKRICSEHWTGSTAGIIETSPERELEEEFADSLHIKISPSNYSLNPKWTVAENFPGKTENVNSPGSPTLRIYYVYEAVFTDEEIVKMIMDNNKTCTDEDLRSSAVKDALLGGKGRANAVLVFGLNELINNYLSITVNGLTGKTTFEDHNLDGNISAILDTVYMRKYQKYTD